MASITRARKTELTSGEIAAVQLSDRVQHGDYVQYTALSRDGVTKYTTILRDGKAIACSCPSTVPCIHRAAVEFEEAWIAPVIAENLGELAEDVNEHAQDDMTSHEKEYAELAETITASEQQRAALDTIAAHVDEQQAAWDAMSLAERRQAYREMYPDDFYCSVA